MDTDEIEALDAPPAGGWDQMDWRLLEKSIDIKFLMAALKAKPYVDWLPYERDLAHHFRSVHANNLRWDCYLDLPE